MTEEITSDVDWRVDQRAVEAVAAAIRALIDHVTPKGTTLQQKFELGDLIGQFQDMHDRIGVRATLPGTTAEYATLLARCDDWSKTLIKAPGIERAAIVDWGRVARAFPPGHPIRTSTLSFSIAKSLTSLDTQVERDAEFEEALLRRPSVQALQEKLSARRGLNPAGASKRKQTKAFICAQTNAPIADLDAMVKVEMPLPARPVPGPAARKTAKKPQYRGAKSERQTLRFRDAQALAQWLNTKQQDYPQAGSTAPSDDTPSSDSSLPSASSAKSS